MIDALTVDGRGRQNPVENDQTFEDALRAVEDAFGSTWLASGRTPLHQLSRRTDWLASSQLFLLGSGIRRMSGHTRWIRGQVAAIRSDESRRRGHIFELVGIPYFAGGLGRVIPTSRGAPGYDAVVDLESDGQLHLSLKNFGVTHKEREFLAAARHLEAHFLDTLAQLRCPALGLMALSKSFAGPQDWAKLGGALDALVTLGPGHRQVGPWTVVVHNLPARFAPYAQHPPSYQVMLHAAHHANERQTVIDSLSRGVSNARRHAANGDDIARVLFVRVHENADLASFTEWAREAILEMDQGRLEAILLYQPALVDLVDQERRAIQHSLVMIANDGFQTWRAGSERRRPAMSLPIGILSQVPSVRQIRLEGNSVPLRGGYFYQCGELYSVQRFDPAANVRFTLGMPGIGIRQNVILTSDFGSITFSPITTPDERITLFD